MANHQTITIDNIILPDQLADQLLNIYQDYEGKRNVWLAEKMEIQKYIFATDTTTTSNSQLPWKNKTTLPKLCQIRDNLYANYRAALFPKRKWLKWEADVEEDQLKGKAKAIEAYMSNVLDRPEFKREVSKMLLDYIDYGNPIATIDWIDETETKGTEGTQKVGYVGPVPVRLSPLDVCFNPIAPSFNRTGKFVRSLMAYGDFASKVMQESSPDDLEASKALLAYMHETRNQVAQVSGKFEIKNEILNVSGFNDFVGYLGSGYVEVITYYGDYYDVEAGELKRNRVITIVDRHKIASDIANPSMLSGDNMWHTGWRVRQDSLWAMGPLDNLVGMQYRIDHLENLKADVFDLIAAPPLMIKGDVQDFTWGPFSKIYVGDDGMVEMLAPDVNALNANLEISNLQNQMEEMAGSPKEAMGFRTPGEKTMYEVQRLENAAARIFATKITQFEEDILEPMLNAMLEMASRKLNTATIRMLDGEENVASFMSITKEDISGSGRIRPMAARNFAERAEMVQNLNAFFTQSLGTDPEVKLHFSSVKLAKMFEDILDIEKYGAVSPYIRLAEQQEAQQLQNAGQEQTEMEAMTPSGLTPDDADMSMLTQ